jgi:hypothetical protein
VAPMRIEVLTTISGVAFDQCYAERIRDTLDGQEVSIISLEHLKSTSVQVPGTKTWTTSSTCRSRDPGLRFWKSFGSQRDHRVHFRRAPRRNVTSKHCHRDQQNRYSTESNRICSRHAEEQR